MKNKHTAGTWEYKKVTPTQIIIGIKGYGTDDNYRKDNRCGQIAIIKGWDGDKTTTLSTEDEANAQLIAHAPELLQMVYDLKKCIKELSQDNVSQFDRDTLAQWEGEAHELLTRINPDWYDNANKSILNTIN